MWTLRRVHSHIKTVTPFVSVDVHTLIFGCMLFVSNINNLLCKWTCGSLSVSVVWWAEPVKIKPRIQSCTSAGPQFGPSNRDLEHDVPALICRLGNVLLVCAQRMLSLPAAWQTNSTGVSLCAHLWETHLFRCVFMPTALPIDARKSDLHSNTATVTNFTTFACLNKAAARTQPCTVLQG